MSIPYNTAWCNHPKHSRPATAVERREDVTQRRDALDAAQALGRLSSRQVKEHKRALITFMGYRRCTLPDERRE